MVAPQQRKRVVTELSLAYRRVRPEAIRPAPEHLEPAPIPDDGIERRQQPHAIVWCADERFAWCHVESGFSRTLRPVPLHAIDAGMTEPPPRALQRAVQFTPPLRHCI